MRRTATAPAKINLFLHVGAVDAENYHPLSSLVAFADVGDLVTMERCDRLSLSVRTVRFHIENIYRKLGVQSRTQAVRVGREEGLLDS